MPGQKCSYCNEQIEKDAILCCECKDICAHLSCIKSRANPSSKTSSRGKWKCDSCTSGTDSLLSSEPQSSDMATLMMLLQQMDQKNTKHQEYSKAQFENLQMQNQELTHKLDEQLKRVNALESKHSELEIHITKQDSAISLLQQQVDDLMQEKLANNVELHGVPERDGEDLSLLVNKVASMLGASDTGEKNAIAYVYRGRKLKNGPRPVIVSFKKHEDKVEWMKNRKAKTFADYRFPVEFSEKAGASGSKSKNPGLQHRSMRIFEQLTPARRQLFFAARQAAYEKNFKYTWTRDGKILVRKNETTKALIRINNLNDIDTKITLGEDASNNKNNPQGPSSNE
jgi:hypothetical protein